MAASLSTLPFRLISLPSISSPKQNHQQSFTISSSLRASTLSPISPIGFGSQSPSPVTRSKLTIPNSTSDEAEAAVGTLETEEPEAEAAGDAAEEEEEAAKPPRPPIVKLGDIMGILNKRAVEAAESERPVPDLRTGDIVEIKLEVPENRRRASIYKGIVISKQNAGIHTTIRIRRIIAGIGVEIVFPV